MAVNLRSALSADVRNFVPSYSRHVLLFFFNDTATTEIYTLSLHDALPISGGGLDDAHHGADVVAAALDREHFIRLAGGGRKGLAVQRVEIRGVGRQRGKLAPIHVVVEVGDAAASLVGNGDAARAAERHGPVAIAGAAAGAV